MILTYVFHLFIILLCLGGKKRWWIYDFPPRIYKPNTYHFHNHQTSDWGHAARRNWVTIWPWQCPFFSRNPTAHDPSASSSRTGMMVKVHRKPRDVIKSRLIQSTHVLCYCSWLRSRSDMMSFQMFQNWGWRKRGIGRYVCLGILNFASILFRAFLGSWNWLKLSTSDLLLKLAEKKSKIYRAAEVTLRWQSVEIFMTPHFYIFITPGFKILIHGHASEAP